MNASTFDFSVPGVHRLYLGFGFQSSKKPNFFNSVGAKELPMER
jgi:TM2 domain-containing membrane protein YozV